MNQKDLVDSLAKHFYFTKAESSRVVDFILDKISIDLQKGNRVYFRGFGSFVKQSLDSKRVRHPKTGKMMLIPKRDTIKFTPSRKLLE